MTNYILKNGRFIDPSQQIDTQQDVYISEGVIVSSRSNFQADKIIDCSGLVVCPGFIDTGARFSIPDVENNTSLSKELQAAVANGITTVICQPDARHCLMDTGPNVHAFLQETLRIGKSHVATIGALTEKLEGSHLSTMARLKEAGCIALGQSYRSFCDLSLWRNAFTYAKTVELPLVIHPSSPSLRQNSVAHEGEVSARLGLVGNPALSEVIALEQALLFQQDTHAKLHLFCLSAAGSVAKVAQAKAHGHAISASVALSHLYLTEKDIEDFNTQAHTFPPLRSHSDQHALLQGFTQGTLDIVCSNHVPLGEMAKAAPFPSAIPGISGFDTFLPLLLGLKEKTKLPLLDILSSVTSNPAAFFNIPAGSLRPGSRADICVFDEKATFTLSAQSMHSAGKNSPWIGWPLQGQVIYTLVNGELLYSK